MENKFVSVFFAPSASKLYWNENRVGHTHGQLAQGLSFFVANEKKETEAGESLKIWRGQSVIHKYKVFWWNGVCFLFDQMLPLYPLDPPALREIRFRSQQRLQSKLNQKSISQHNVYNFDFFLQAYYKSSAKSAGLYK